METHCKQLDFSLATEGASTSSFQGDSSDSLTKWSTLKLELRTSVKYAEVVSDLLTYATISLEDVTGSQLHKSLLDELEAVKMRTKDLVHLRS